MADPTVPSTSSSESSQNWERETLMRIAMVAIHEQKLNRRWNIFFRILFVVLFFLFIGVMYLFASIALFFNKPLMAEMDQKNTAHTALIELKSVIMEDSRSSATNFTNSLRAALKDKKTKGIIIRANSPGGSAVQAATMYDEIKRLRKAHPDIKIYAVVTDYCFSACYYIISAADQIYANRQSMVGSIGVIHMSFGMTELLSKIGIESRVLTAGKNKAFMNPFAPLNPEHVAHYQSTLKQMHEIFIRDVKQGRQTKLKADNPDVFSGLMWNAEQAKELGLFDGYGDVHFVASTLIGAEKIVDFSPKPGFLNLLLNETQGALKNEILQQMLAPGVY